MQVDVMQIQMLGSCKGNSSILLESDDVSSRRSAKAERSSDLALANCLRMRRETDVHLEAVYEECGLQKWY